MLFRLIVTAMVATTITSCTSEVEKRRKKVLEIQERLRAKGEVGGFDVRGDSGEIAVSLSRECSVADLERLRLTAFAHAFAEGFRRLECDDPRTGHVIGVDLKSIAEYTSECQHDPWRDGCADLAKQAPLPSTCESDARKREEWIQASSSELEGRAPAAWGISAVGACSATLRVRENECSAQYLAEAYGDKPFMRTARALGFRKMSCGHDEFDLTTLAGR